MKKVTALILILTITLTLFSGCGSKGSNNNNGNSGTKPSTADSTSSAGNDSKTSGGSDSSQPKEVPGAELSTFMGNYVDTKTKIWDVMTEKLEQDQNGAFTFGALAFVFADLSIIEIGLFDTLITKEGDLFKGKLMLSGIEAWKRVKGDIIEFGYDYTNPEDKNQTKKGDKEISNGKFDKKTGTLVYERSTERNGSKISRYVVEITRNSDKSYSSQIYSIETDQSSNNDEKTLNCYCTWFEGENIISIIAGKGGSNYDFKYESIFGKKNMKPKDMTKGMDVKSIVSFIDGKASYEEVGK